MAVTIYDKDFDFDGTQIMFMVCDRGCHYMMYQTFKSPQAIFDLAFHGEKCAECEQGTSHPSKIMDESGKWVKFTVIEVDEVAGEQLVFCED